MDSFLEEALEPRWSRYGLRGDPFWSNALDPEDVTTRPITLFRGRDEERRRLIQSVLDGDHSATLIHAAGGHGKTTLANAAAYTLAQRGYLVLPEEIQFSVEDGALGFLGEFLRGILQALHDRDVALPKVPDDPADATDLPALTEARRLVHLLRVRTGWSAAGQAAGFGAGGGAQYSFLQPAYEPAATKRLIADMLREIASLDLDVEGVVVRVNNLDVAVAQDAPALANFLLTVRDLLQVDGIHWLLMGNDAVRDIVEGEARVCSVFENPLPLGPFTRDEVQTILHGRYDFLRLPDRAVTPPVHEDLVASLYDIHYGDLRNMLRDLRRAVQVVDPVEADPIEPDQALPMLQRLHFEQYNRRLSPEAWRTLAALGASEEPLRQKDLAPLLGVSEAAVSNRFKNLQEHRVIELVRSEGRSQYWRVPGHVRMALEGARGAGFFAALE